MTITHCRICGTPTSPTGHCPSHPLFLHELFQPIYQPSDPKMDKVLYDISEHIAWNRADARRQAISECAAECEAVRMYCGRGGGDAEGDYFHEYATGAMACLSRIRALTTDTDTDNNAGEKL